MVIVRLFWAFIGIIVGVAILCQCNIDKKKKVDRENVKFQTTDSSVLFFKNLRQIVYDRFEDKETKLDAYRIKDRPIYDEKPALNLCIINNWRNDQAYILIEPNAYLEGQDTLKVLWADGESGESGAYTFEQGNKIAHFQFAVDIYNSVLEGHQMEIWTAEGGEPFLAVRDERESFRKTMVDYLRLVNIYR